jgi:hypothetical protein
MMHLEWIWKETVIAKSRYYPGIFLEELRKTSVRIRDVLTEIQGEHLPLSSDHPASIWLVSVCITWKLVFSVT